MSANEYSLCKSLTTNSKNSTIEIMETLCKTLFYISNKFCIIMTFTSIFAHDIDYDVRIEWGCRLNFPLSWDGIEAWKLDSKILLPSSAKLIFILYHTRTTHSLECTRVYSTLSHTHIYIYVYPHMQSLKISFFFLSYTHNVQTYTRMCTDRGHQLKSNSNLSIT